MQESLIQTIPETTKNKIRSLLPEHQTALYFTLAKLYVSGFDSGGFIDTSIGGILVISLDRIKHCLFIQIYDYYRNLLEFEVEVYHNIAETLGYKVLKEQFHAIQYPFGYIGLNFPSKTVAEKVKNTIILNSKVFIQIKNDLELIIEPKNPKKSIATLYYESEIKEFDIISNTKIKPLLIVLFCFKQAETKELKLSIDSIEFESRSGNIANLEIHYKILNRDINKELKDTSVIRTNFVNTSKFIEYDEFKRKTLLLNNELPNMNQNKLIGNINKNNSNRQNK